MRLCQFPAVRVSKMAVAYMNDYQGGVAWRYDENELVKAKYRTYAQFRGYGKVLTRNGDGANDPQTLSETTYRDLT